MHNNTLFGVLVFLPFTPIRRLPVLMAYRFGALTLDSRIIGLSYIIFTFFLMPFTLIYVNKDSSEQRTYTYTIESANEAHTGVVVFNSEGLNAEIRYLLYDDFAQDGNFSVPDTSFLLPKSSASFVTPSERIDIEFNSSNVSNLGISEIYEFKDEKLDGLQKIKCVTGDGLTIEYLIDPVNHILISSIKTDSLNNQIESIQLIGIE